MFKLFHGFQLVETYHELKKARRQAENRLPGRIVKLSIATIVALVLWLLPMEAYGIPGLTVIEQRLIAIFD